MEHFTVEGKTIHILLVEDDEVDAIGIERALHRARIVNPVHRARDGVEALDMLKGRDGKAQIPSPRQLLVDINMPRMNGIELVQKLREDPLLRQSAVFMLTTSKSDEDKLAAYNLNVAGYIVKERAGEDFLRLIEMVDHYWRVVELPD